MCACYIIRLFAKRLMGEGGSQGEGLLEELVGDIPCWSEALFH